jgi:integrase
VAIQSLSEEQVLAVLAAARSCRERDFVFFLLTYRCGFRVSETIHLTPDNFSDGFVTVQRLKGSRKTTNELFPSANPLLDVRKAVFDYTLGMLRNQRLFKFTRQHADRLMKRYGKLAGLPAYLRHMHVWKHTICTEIVDKADVPTAQAWVGHVSGSSTLIYTEKTQQQAESGSRVGRETRRRVGSKTPSGAKSVREAEGSLSNL